MKNLRSAKALTGYTVHASDGDIGKIRELYFDDAEWRVRYIVADINRWRPGRKVLLSPWFVQDVRWESRELRVSVTTEQVKNCPDIDTDKPVALQRLAEKHKRHNWALFMAGEALAAVPEALEIPAFKAINKNGKPFDPHLRTTKIVTGLTLRASDGNAGRIVDFIIDDESWAVRYLVIELGDRRRVLLVPSFVKDIVIEESAVTIDGPARLVADCPTLDPSTLLTGKYEESVAAHYQVHG